MKYARLFARLAIGGMFFAHGTQKLLGWFDGPGLDGATGMMDKLGLAPARTNALAAASSETFGGAAIALGAATPLAATSLIATMVTAIRTVHWKNGFFSSNGGYEYNLTIIAALLLLADAGPGPISIDAAFGIEESGPGVALAAAAAGVIGSTVTLAAANAAHAKATSPAPETTAAA
jgi:putative oxidoreductase